MRFILQALGLLLLPTFIASCDPAPPTASDPGVTDEVNANPAAEGFNISGSDAKAIAIADSVMVAHGGRKTYDAARYFHWDFFGARTLTWDKFDELVRIEVPRKEMTYLLDYSDSGKLTGAVSRAGQEMTDPDSIDLYLQSANSMFINDSYWLVQPFKLKDSGVTLKYVGAENDPQKARPSEVIELTFKDVGDTPGNRYRLYVDRESYRINTWQFFRNAADEEPAITTPYDGYREYNGLMISGDRGGRFQLGDISVSGEMEDAEATFTEF